MNEITGNLLKLSLVRDLGAVRLRNLLEYFGSTRNILKAKENELCCVSGIGKQLSSQISSVSSEVDIEKELKQLQKNGISVISIYDKNYPANLKTIYDAPFYT